MELVEHPVRDGGTNELDIAICDPSNTGFTLDIDNPFFPLVPGSQLVLEDEDAAERVRFTVLGDIEEVAGVETRVVEEYETEDEELVEISRNFFAQAADGTVCYFGEDVDIYEGGVVVDDEGTWRAGVDGAEPGIIMPASPAVGMVHAQETAPGSAEDQALVIAVGDEWTVPADTFTDTVEVREWSMLDAAATSAKVYAEGVGLIYDSGVGLIAE